MWVSWDSTKFVVHINSTCKQAKGGFHGIQLTIVHVNTNNSTNKLKVHFMGLKLT